MDKKIVKKGIVLANMITHKRGGYIYKGKPVTSEDVNNFDEAVKNKTIEVDVKSIEKFKAAEKKHIDEAKAAEKERIARAKLAGQSKEESVKALADANLKVEKLEKDLTAKREESVKALAEKDEAVKLLNAEIADLKTKLNKAK